MSRTIISILSDQLIPNVLFIKQMGEKGDRHIFLSTDKMEKKHKSKTLVKTLNIAQGNYQTVVIDQNSPSEILEVLESKFQKDVVKDELIVNITGGTKMMSQMAYLHFWGFDNATIYYWPIGEKYIEQLHPSFRRVEVETPVRLNLKTYFSAYGYEITKDEDIEFDYSKTDALFRQVVQAGDSAEVAQIVNATKETYKRADKQYLIGGWFEEWVYFMLRKELKLKKSEIGLNVKIKNESSKHKGESDNELDVAFVYKNSLYIIECKVYNAKQLSAKRITDAIYKISSVRQSLGLRATAMVFILSPFGTNKQRKNSIQDIMRMANVSGVFSLENMKNKHSFINEIKKIVNYE